MVAATFATTTADPLSPAAAFAALGGRLLRRRYAKGQVIFLAGEPETSLAIIEQGAVKLALTSAEGRELVLARLCAGDVFGELSFLDGGSRAADAVAVEVTQLL